MSRERYTRQEPNPVRSQTALTRLSPFFGDTARPIPPGVSHTTMEFLYVAAQQGAWDTLSDNAVAGLLLYFTSEFTSLSDVGTHLPGRALSGPGVKWMLEASFDWLHDQLRATHPEVAATLPRDALRLRERSVSVHANPAHEAKRIASMRRRWSDDKAKMMQLVHSPEADEKRRERAKQHWKDHYDDRVKSMRRYGARRTAENLDYVQQGLAEGKTEREIAQEIGLSESSVRGYRHRLGVHIDRHRVGRKRTQQEDLQRIGEHLLDPAVQTFLWSVTDPLDRAILHDIIVANRKTYEAIGREMSVSRQKVQYRTKRLIRKITALIAR